MSDTHNDPPQKSPVADASGLTDAELAVAVRRAIQAVPDQATQARLDRRVAEALKRADSTPSSNNRTA